MTREIMMFIMVISAALLAIGLSRIVIWISRKVHKPESACMISALLGVVLAIILMIIAYWVLPAMSRAMMIGVAV